MSSIFITGSSDGIGQETARQLARDGHRVVLHARNDARAEQAFAAVPEAAGVAIGDLSVIAGIHQTAAAASTHGPFDVVIHNAGVGGGRPRQTTADGNERIFAVNVLGPYLLTALMDLPEQRSRSRAGCRRRVATRSTPAGSRRSWAARAPPTSFRSARQPRSGWPPPTIPPPR